MDRFEKHRGRGFGRKAGGDDNENISSKDKKEAREDSVEVIELVEELAEAQGYEKGTPEFEKYVDVIMSELRKATRSTEEEEE